jgi:membrane fusion protein (multidrug efflux system)
LRVTSYFANPGNLLRPGQYARIRLASEDEGKGAIVVPQRAVAELQGKTFVWVVDAANKVSQRAVSTGARVGSDWVISDGLKAGERIVTDGLQKVRDGAVVVPQSAKP